MQLSTEYHAGLRHGRSIEEKVLRLSQTISDGSKQSPLQRTVVGLIDYSKAYEDVCRDALLMKMSKKGIPSHMVLWNQVWLSNRLIWVMLDGDRSRISTMMQGVPQESILSPLLFILYIDDLVSAVGAPQISLFADDVPVWAQDTDLERATAKLQEGLDAMTSWITSWKMELSAEISWYSFLSTKTQEAK